MFVNGMVYLINCPVAVHLVIPVHDPSITSWSSVDLVYVQSTTTRPILCQVDVLSRISYVQCTFSLHPIYAQTSAN